MKKLFALVTSFGIAISASLVFSIPSQAETGYRYWSYWMFQNGQWEMASEGAGTTAATDGQMQGWRFVTAGVDASADLAPRTEATFDDICKDVAAEVGAERVAFIIDFGDASDYEAEVTIPQTEVKCVTVESGSPSTLVLAKVATVREMNGFVCAINDMPKTGCGESVEIESDTTTSTLLTTSAAPAEESNETDWLSTVVTAGLGVIVFVMAFRRMQWQKAQKLKNLEEKKANEDS